MHKHRYGHGRRGRGFGRRRVPNAEKMLEWLEEYQRDLEQEVADVADLIRRLKTEPQQTATV
jgi:hypothetical protein